MPKVPDHLLSRPPLDRMMQIHTRLQAGKYPNCTQLAKAIEVSTRTIKRDIDFMKYRLQLPIEYDQTRYGYYYSRTVKQFPGVVVTEADIFALLVAQKVIDQYRGTSFYQPLERAFRKLTSQLDGSEEGFTLGSIDGALSIRPFAPEDSDLTQFQVLADGVQKRREIKFHYKNLGARQAQARHVRPYHLACIDNHWYLFAFDLGRKAMRTFSLTRLKGPKLTAKTFKRPVDFNADEYLKGSFTVFKGQDDFEVVLDFDPWATDLIRGRRWHGTQQFTELPDGCSRLRLRLNNIEEVERWVLSWGIHATVVRPRRLIERLCRISVALSSRYDDDPPAKR